MPSQQCLARQPERDRIQLTFQFRDELHGVDVGSLIVIQRVEKQALLERYKRKDVAHARTLHRTTPQSLTT
jgi:hypothetical protein